MFRRFSLVLLSFLVVFTLSSCTEEPKTDSELVREIRDGIIFELLEIDEDINIPTISNEDVVVTWTSSNPDYLTINGEVTVPNYMVGNKTVSLTVTLQLGESIVNKVFEFIIISEERPEIIELNTNETDNLALDFAYENYDFIADGVGEVTLVSCVDGDTAFFTEGGATFSVRFLGINTPESTAKFEPWGKPASDYTCDKLENATTIVLRADPESGRMDSYGTRWLAWVWYDGRLLNLELVEQAYSKASGSMDTYYGNLIFQVNLRIQFSERRVWGEIDPTFDYSLEGTQITIEELVTNPGEYYGTKVVLTGIVTRKLGGAVFIQQGDYGVYVYNRAWAPHLVIGNEIRISAVTVTYFPDEETGALQVSGYSVRTEYSEVLSSDNVVTSKTVLISEITGFHVGSLLKLENLTVISIDEGENTDSFTITAEDSLGNVITIRKDADSPNDILVSMFPVGTVFTVIGPLSRYKSSYQLMLTSLDDIVIE